jgi:hypothetical protein
LIRSIDFENNLNEINNYKPFKFKIMSQSYEVIFENNRKWVESKVAEDPNFFHELAKTQTS